MKEKVEILFEDDNVLVINKPAGLLVHGDGRSKEKTLVDFIQEMRPEIAVLGETISVNGVVIVRPGIVHRLDKETSGVLIIAKTDEAFVSLKTQFKNRRIEKVYKAFVIGVPKEERGVIDREIRKSKSDFRKWTSYKGRGTSREAITNYRVLESVKGYSYLELRPKTGRTHQIRVHLSSIGHPIIGDTMYGKGQNAELGFDRLALHAESISFYDLEGGKVTVSAPIPDDFIKAEKALKDIAKS